MKVAQLLQQLAEQDPAAEVRVMVPHPDRYAQDGSFSAEGVMEASDEPVVFVTG